MQLFDILAPGLLVAGAAAAALPNTAQPLRHLEARGRQASSSVTASAGCGKAPPAEPGQWKSDATGAGREYRVFVPPEYDEARPAPLILSYHGATQNVNQQARRDRLTDPRFNTDHIVVYLQGARRDPSRSGSTSWQGAPDAPEGADDFAFTADVLDAVEAELCVDKARIYATGKSQGGGFVGLLACDANLSRRIAAFAPVAGAFYNTEVDQRALCNPATVENRCEAARGGASGSASASASASVPILALHGGGDDVIRFGGGFRKGACLPAVRHWAEDWARRNGLDLDLRGGGGGAGPAETPIEGTAGGVAYRYGGGEGLVTLVYAGDDVGHVWMSRDAGNAGFEASDWIMEFFRKHTL